jgi:hypothetical protein
MKKDGVSAKCRRQAVAGDIDRDLPRKLPYIAFNRGGVKDHFRLAAPDFAPGGKRCKDEGCSRCGRLENRALGMHD